MKKIREDLEGTGVRRDDEGVDDEQVDEKTPIRKMFEEDEELIEELIENKKTQADDGGDEKAEDIADSIRERFIVKLNVILDQWKKDQVKESKAQMVKTDHETKLDAQRPVAEQDFQTSKKVEDQEVEVIRKPGTLN